MIWCGFTCGIRAKLRHRHGATAMPMALNHFFASKRVSATTCDSLFSNHYCGTADRVMLDTNSWWTVTGPVDRGDLLRQQINFLLDVTECKVLLLCRPDWAMFRLNYSDSSELMLHLWMDFAMGFAKNYKRRRYMHVNKSEKQKKWQVLICVLFFF